jgi:hypothetical protein
MLCLIIQMTIKKTKWGTCIKKGDAMYYTFLFYDIIEILFYSFIIYSFCIWLKTDKTKNLLGYFMVYCISVIGAWAIDLPTIVPFLCTYSPVAIMLFIILHEKTLQRNLVTLRTLTPAQPIQENWLDILLSATLSTINNNKSVTVIIENTDSLDYFLITPFSINADLGKEILNILFLSNFYDESKMIWINTHGRIRGINSTWQSETNFEQAHRTLFNKQDALFYTLQNDALIFHINPLVRTFSIITQGKETNNVSPHDIQVLIKKTLSHASSRHKKEFSYARATTEKSINQ